MTRRWPRAAIVLSAVSCCWFAAARAQDAADVKTDESGVQPAPRANPADFGLELPDAPPKQPAAPQVVVKNALNEVVVAKSLVEVGDRLVVMLPDGRLHSVPQREATPTDRRFQPVTMEQLGKAITAGGFAGFKTRSTRHYVFIYNTSELFYQGTSRILETLKPGVLAYCRKQKLKVHDPEVPLAVIMFRTQDEFNQFHAMPEGVIAYYNGVTNYVVLYEQSRLLDIAPDLAVKQSISTIAHEGVHQILHNIGVQQRLSQWPIWISEGLPEYFAPTTVGERVRWKGIGKPNDLRMRELEDYLKQGAGKNDLVQPTIEAEGLTSTGYAAAWSLTHFLAGRRRTRFFSYLAEVSQRGPLAEFTPRQNVELFTKHFSDEYSKLDTELVDHLMKLPYDDPIVNQTHYVVMMEAGARRGYALTTSPKAIVQWQEEQLAKMPTAVFVIQAFPNADTAKLFAKGWLRSR